MRRGAEPGRAADAAAREAILGERVIDATGSAVREQGRFPGSIGIFPELEDGYGILIMPATGSVLRLET